MLRAVLTEEEVAALDEGFRSHYRKRDDGSFILDVGSVGGVELQDVAALKTALSKERKLRADAEKRAKDSAERFGDLDPEAAREALAKLEELGGLDGDEKRRAELEAAKSELEAKFQRDKDALDAAAKKAASDHASVVGRMTEQLTREMITSRAVKAVAGAKGSPDLLLPLIEQRTRVVEQPDGSFAVRVHDASGNVLLSPKSGSTDPMSIQEFVDGLKADGKFAAAFDGADASGAGGSRVGKGGPAGTKTVPMSDHKAVGRSLEQIASGEVEVDVAK